MEDEVQPPVKKQKIDESVKETKDETVKQYFLAVPGGLEWIAADELREKIEDASNIRILQKEVVIWVDSLICQGKARD